MLISSFQGPSVWSGGLGFMLAGAAERALQDSLNVLATIVDDPKIGVKVDGIIGPKTAAAYNRAAKRYLTVAPARGRTGKLSVATIRKHADRFTNFIREEITKRTGAPTRKRKVEPEDEKKTPAPKPKTAAARTLQKAVRELGAQRNDSALRIAVDGIVGPKTTKAVNRAFTSYVKEAPSQYRTGKLSRSTVRSKAAVLATLIEREIERYKKAPTPTPKPAPKPTPTVQVSKADVRKLQAALRNLSTIVKDPVLKIAVDGIVGPRTTQAVNKALQTHVADRGRFQEAMPVAAVKANVQGLTQVFSQELQRRGTQAPAPRAAAPAPTPAPAPGPTVSVARMQRAVAQLSRVVQDPNLAIRADGIVGPNTTRAVNAALQNYVMKAPASLRQRLTPDQISALSEEIAQAIQSEASKRLAEKAEEQARRERPTQRRPAAAPTPVPEPTPAPIPARVAPPEEEEVRPARIEVEPEIELEKKKFPWWAVGVGVGSLVVGGLAVAAFRKSPQPEPA